MKYKFIYIFFFLIIGSMNILSSENFFLRIHLSTDEVSKDSHSDTYIVVVEDKNVSYKWNHHGYPDNDEKKKSYKISEDKLKKLINYIKHNKLNRNLKEIRESGKLGLSASIFVEVRLEGITTKIDISGMYNDWRKKNRNKSNIKNIEYYHIVNSLVKALENEMDHF